MSEIPNVGIEQVTITKVTWVVLPIGDPWGWSIYLLIYEKKLL